MSSHQSTPRKGRLAEASAIARDFIRYLLNARLRDRLVVSHLMVDLTARRGQQDNREAYTKADFNKKVLPKLKAASKEAHPVTKTVHQLLLMFDERPLFMTDEQLERVAKYLVDTFRLR